MVSFLTPFWSGRDMMRIHLRSLREHHPSAPILISKRGGERDLMEEFARDFGVEYFLEDCTYTDAYLRLLQRCRTRFACVIDHDTVLLTNVNAFADRIDKGECDLVGIEERIRLPHRVAGLWSGSNGWLRFAPGNVASNFLVFDWQSFKRRFGLRGVFGEPQAGARHFDFDYGIGQRLPRHHYLRPYHVERYGIGNLLTDDARAVVWHQWYGAHTNRLADPDSAGVREIVELGERAFVTDYPALNFAGRTPAWGDSADVDAEHRLLRDRIPSASRRWRRRAGAQVRAIRARVAVASATLRGQSRSRSSVTQ